MITDETIKCLRERLCLLVKYTSSGPFYWNKKCNRFVPLSSYFSIQWHATHYAGFIWEVTLLIYSLFSLVTKEIPEEGQSTQEATESVLLPVLGIGLWFIISSIRGFGSICTEYQHEITLSLNKLLEMDRNYTELYPGCIHPKTLVLERIIKLITTASLLCPPGFSMIFFHPENPIRNMFQSILETELSTSSPAAWLLFALQIWGVLAYGGIAVTGITHVAINVFACGIWLELLTPVNSASVYIKGERHFQTEQLGRIGEKELVRFYRTMQVCCQIENEWTGKVRVAFHHIALVMIGVICAFSLIKYTRNLIEEGLFTGMIFTLGLLLVGLTAAFFCYMECYHLGNLDSKWRAFKEKLLRGSKRNQNTYKVARSFGVVTIQTAYPFFSVKNSTFMELCTFAVCRLVDLLLTFK